MKTTTLIILGLLLLVPGVLAADWPICIDKQSPQAPTGLATTGNLVLSWNAAADAPACSGIASYTLLRDGVILTTTSALSFTDGPLADGTYTYSVRATDRAGNVGPLATITATISTASGGDDGGDGTGGGGGGGGGSGGGSVPVVQTATNDTNGTGGEQAERPLPQG